MSAVPPLRVGSLFSGAGMLDVAVRRVLNAEPSWFVENDPAASKVLDHHWLDVPNQGDITTVDWGLVEPVDVLCGGFPCQDVSTAGRRAGMRPGTRSGLWSHMAYAVSQLKPGLVVIENVRGLLSADAVCDVEPCAWCVGDDEGGHLRALGGVLGDLADLGYDAQWCGLRASDVGAPHGRFRVFICARPVGHSDGFDSERWPPPGLTGEAGPSSGPAPDTRGVGPFRSGRAWSGWRGPADRDQSAADTEGHGRDEGWPEPGRQLGGPDAALSGAGAVPDPDSAGRGTGGGLGRRTGATVERDCAPVAVDTAGRRGDAPAHTERGELQRRGVPSVMDDTAGPGEGEGPKRQRDRHAAGNGGADVVDWGAYGPAIARWELIMGRPAPAPTATGKRGGQQLSALFTEWMMGWPEGWVSGVPGLSRSDQLRICGNGVVPQQAVAALVLLLDANGGAV